MKKIKIRIGSFIREYDFNEPQDVLDQLLLDLPLPPYLWRETYSLYGDDTFEVSELIDEYIDLFPTGGNTHTEQEKTVEDLNHESASTAV